MVVLALLCTAYMLKDNAATQNVDGPGNLQKIKCKVENIVDYNVVEVEITDLFGSNIKKIYVGAFATVNCHRSLLFPYISPNFKTPSTEYKIKKDDIVTFYIAEISDDNGLVITIGDYFTLVK